MAAMLSRTSTIVASMQRLNLTSSNYNGEQQFRMYIIGSDEMELVCFNSSTSDSLPEA